MNFKNSDSSLKSFLSRQDWERRSGMKTKQPRRAFYPCCAADIEEPRRLLAGTVDEIIFCDIRPYKSWVVTATNRNLPDVRFEIMDVRSYLPNLPQISVLFY